MNGLPLFFNKGLGVFLEILPNLFPYPPQKITACFTLFFPNLFLNFIY